MGLLEQGIQENKVIQTAQRMKLTIDGITEEYPIYKVRLDTLYYNDQNDRIATWMSEYHANNPDSNLSDDKEKLNEVIQAYIIKSNEARLKMTKDNIKNIGQQKPGVVLNDGRVIDGNRRFTCLRLLAQDDEKFNWFETIILNRDYKHDEKQIKMLELQIQIGEDQKVDYNPVDRLVGVYRDLIKEKLLSIEEYARSTNRKKAEVEKDIELAELMAEFLDFINAHEKFYIARDLAIDGPLNEAQGILRKERDEDARQRLKCVIFANLAVKPIDDMTRFIRDIKKIQKAGRIEQFVGLETPLVEQFSENLPPDRETKKDDLSRIKVETDLAKRFEGVMKSNVDCAGAVLEKERPAHYLDNSFVNIKAIFESSILSDLGQDEREEINEKIDNIIEKLNELRDLINV